MRKNCDTLRRRTMRIICQIVDKFDVPFKCSHCSGMLAIFTNARERTQKSTHTRRRGREATPVRNRTVELSGSYATPSFQILNSTVVRTTHSTIDETKQANSGFRLWQVGEGLRMRRDSCFHVRACKTSMHTWTINTKHAWTMSTRAPQHPRFIKFPPREPQSNTDLNDPS